MSRSRRTTPIIGITTAVSEKQDKAQWHRQYRRAENQRMVAEPESEPHHIRRFFNPWNMAKDGKGWCANRPDLMRK